MAQPLVVEQSLVIAVPVEDAFRRTLPMPLPDLFKRWHGPIPPIKEVRDQTGAWDAAGQTRTVFLAGGGSMREELTSVDPPRSFGYLLTKIRGPMTLWSTTSRANGSSRRPTAAARSPGAGPSTASRS